MLQLYSNNCCIVATFSANQTMCQVHRLMHLLLTTMWHQSTFSHIEKRQIERTNFRKEWKTRIFWLTPPSKYRLKMSWPRDVNRLSQELKCQKHIAKATYIYPKRMACVSCGVNFWAQRDSWRRETWFMCVTCGKWAHELCGNLDPVNFMCNPIGCMDSD